MGEYEAEIEKIKIVFLVILRDIKKDIGSGKQPGKAATGAMLQTMRDTLAGQHKSRHQRTMLPFPVVGKEDDRPSGRYTK